MPEVEIIGECATGEEAVADIQSRHPDLVLLDIQMPGCTGMEVVRRVGPANMPMITFVTAYDEYAVEAFELNALDYLLKPFDEPRVRATIERALERRNALDNASLAHRLQALLDNGESSRPKRLALKSGDRYELVPVDSIDWIESANNYVEMHCGGATRIFSETLTGLERKLDPQSFLRVHRCRIVNVSRIRAVHPLGHGAYALELRDNMRLTTGRQFRGAVEALLRR